MTEGDDTGGLVHIAVASRKVTRTLLRKMLERDAEGARPPAPVTATGDTEESMSRVKGSGR